MSEAGEIRYTITGDNSGLRTSLEGVNRQAEQTAQTVSSISEAISSTAESGAAAQTAINGIAASAENAAAAAEQIGTDANTAATGIGTAAVNSQQLLAQMEQIAGSLNGIAESTANMEHHIEEAGKKSEESGKKGESAFGKIGKAAGKAAVEIGKIALAATGAAATAVGVLAKNAIESYSEYEQLVGGVETLFGDSADVIQGYAEEAFSTVGMSCNAYMEIVTGFAASLVSSLDGDTAKAAEKANTAVSDMSDNANKMGTDLQSIQNAYQGFAKQNYTMLDNLKLGYGGTKEEMERLLAEAEKIQKTKFGIDIDYDVSSFSDIVDAIHVIQEDMGITGTTAKEASTTIQGSISTMQAAWQNLMTGIADPTQDFDKLLDDVIDSVVTVSNNLIPRIEAVLPQMATGVKQLAEGILPLIPDTLNAMLPDVIDGANSLIAALLDTLSSIADTAIPIVTENADEIIDTLLTGLISAIPNLASSAADLCTALITAILDNADIITQGAVDIVVALAEGIGNNLDTLIPAAVRAILTIVDTLIYNIDEILDAAEELIRGLADGLIDALPELLAKAPEIVIDLVAALTEAIPDTIEFAVELCERIGSNIANYDWGTLGEDMSKGISDAIDNALHADKDYSENMAKAKNERIKRYSNLTQEQLDKMIEDTQKKFIEWDTLSTQTEFEYSELPEWMRKEMEYSGETSIKKYLDDNLKASRQTLADLKEARETAETEFEKLGTAGNFSDDAAKRAEEEAKKHFEGLDKATTEEVENLILTGDELKEAITAIDNAYALGNYDSETQYWADRLALLEANRNEEDQQWIKYYSQTKQHYEKAVETENKAQEQAKKEAESKLKESVENKFRELETEQLQKGYDDSWLLEQERAFLETLDHNSEAYKDFNLKLLKEQKSTDDKAAKEAETAAKKQRDAVEKSYNSIVKSRDSLAKSLSSGGDVFNSSEETDKRTGAKTKKRSIDLAGFEKKIEAKKKLTSKIAELIEKNTPDDIITELLKQDPEDALAFANELLKSPDKLKKLSKGIQNDDAYSKIIANMVTENSDEFRQLGTDAGTVFGEGFMAAFQANWEESFKSVFDDDYVDTAAANVTAANSSAGISANTAAANTTASDSSETAAKKSSGTSGGTSSGTYRVVDINGKYVATVVNNENARSARTGGR